MNEQTTFQLSDDTIAIIRELVQLSLLTGTNVIDHFRAIRVSANNGKLYPTKEYIEAYNEMIQKLEEDAKKLAEQDRS